MSKTTFLIVIVWTTWQGAWCENEAVIPLTANDLWCSACPTGQSVTSDVHLDIPDFPNISCSDAATILKFMFLPESDDCGKAQAVVMEKCGCSLSMPNPVSPPISVQQEELVLQQAPLFTPTAIGIASSFLTTESCSLCPEGQAVLRPELVVPGFYGMTCIKLQEATIVVPPEDCEIMRLICGCDESLDSDEPPPRVCSSLCMDGSPPPFPSEIALSGLDPVSGSLLSITCEQFDKLVIMGKLSSDGCQSAQYIGVNSCRCDPVGFPPPRCELCGEPASPQNPFFDLGINSTMQCLDLLGSLLYKNITDEECAAYRAFASDYCGCGESAPPSRCRICADNTPLAAPRRVVDNRTCGEWELLANREPDSKCLFSQTLYRSKCCNNNVTPAPTANETPNPPTSTSNGTPNEPSYNPETDSSPSIPAQNEPSSSGCVSLCFDGQPVPNSDAVAFIDNGIEVLCSHLDAIISDVPTIFEVDDCLAMTYIGVRKCGCPNILPEVSCELCEDGSAPLNPALPFDDEMTCAELAVNSQDFEPAACKSLQVTAGVYCGCRANNQELACRICGNDTLLPTPGVYPITPDAPCAILEYEATYNPDLCSSYQQMYAPSCCAALNSTISAATENAATPATSAREEGNISAQTFTAAAGADSPNSSATILRNAITRASVISWIIIAVLLAS